MYCSLSLPINTSLRHPGCNYSVLSIQEVLSALVIFLPSCSRYSTENLTRHFSFLSVYSNKIKFRNTINKRNDVSVSSWHHFQVKNATEKIIYT